MTGQSAAAEQRPGRDRLRRQHPHFFSLRFPGPAHRPAPRRRRRKTRPCTYLSPGGYTDDRRRRQQDHRLLQPLRRHRRDHRPPGQRHPLLLRQQPEPDQGRSARGAPTYTYTYDANGNLTSQTDPLGLTTTFTYNANNDLTSYTDAKGNTTSYAYDSRTTCSRSPTPTAPQQQYTYNPLGEATSIEYNYERAGEIIVPAGAKAVGHIRNGDRSGYVDVQFDSLLMPDGAVVPIEAAATGLDLRPLKGKVEGKNTGKNVLVRSLSGIGQAGSMLVGQGSLNQPLSESDLMRERVSNNVGEAGDEEISRLAITQHIVVTISADTPIYVVLEQTPKSNQGSQQPSARSVPISNSANIDQLRQLLQLQQELSQSPTSNQSPQ